MESNLNTAIEQLKSILGENATTIINEYSAKISVESWVCFFITCSIVVITTIVIRKTLLILKSDDMGDTGITLFMTLSIVLLITTLGFVINLPSVIGDISQPKAAAIERLLDVFEKD